MQKNLPVPHLNHAPERHIQDKALREYLACLADKLGAGIRAMLPLDPANPLVRHFYHRVQTSKNIQSVQDTFVQAYEAARQNLGRLACDSMALSVLKHYGAQRNIEKDYMTTPVWQQRQIVRAAELNLGISSIDRIAIQNSGIASSEMDGFLNYWHER